mmetsp:Transcript_94091/g.236159  ORF Transcript_94091/g.236159 Transcript_94091/m.236159 type:complete len:208 (-) Transcript_94091:642-1265(-)
MPATPPCWTGSIALRRRQRPRPGGTCQWMSVSATWRPLRRMLLTSKSTLSGERTPATQRCRSASVSWSAPWWRGHRRKSRPSGSSTCWRGGLRGTGVMRRMRPLWANWLHSSACGTAAWPHWGRSSPPPLMTTRGRLRLRRTTSSRCMPGSQIAKGVPPASGRLKRLWLRSPPRQPTLQPMPACRAGLDPRCLRHQQMRRQRRLFMS